MINNDGLLQLVHRRQRLVERALRRKRLLATDPLKVFLPPHARRFVEPLGPTTLAEGGLDSKILAVDEGNMSAGFVISAVRRDRHGDTVVPVGCKDSLPDYCRNARVFFAHNTMVPGIASCLKKDGSGELDLQIQDDLIVSRAYWHGKTQLSTETFELVAAGELQAASIGFFPIEGEIIEASPAAPTPDGPAPMPGEPFSFDMGGIVFHKWSIIEWSVVPIPANPEAVRARLSSAWGQRASPVLRKTLMPYASKPKVLVRGGYVPRPPQGTVRHWSPQLAKAFEVSEQKLRPASTVINFASKHLGVKIKDIYRHSLHVPAAKVGSFLTAWRDVISQMPVADIRNIAGDSERPPVYEAIRLNSTKTDDFLIEGVVFYKGGLPLVVDMAPNWGGLSLTLYSRREQSKDSLALGGKAWDLATREYNFLRGEAFSLSGEFIPKTREGFEDIFLVSRNEKSITRTLKGLNSRQLAFANRGSIFLGPPGTGKTLSGRVLRNQAKATFIWVSARDFYYMGSFGGLSYAFELARELAPTVLFFEDIDNWLHDHTIDLFKTEMDGIGRSSGVWTILTTNFPERLPEALIDRPGRFHDVLKFDLPDADCRTRMLKRWLPALKGSAQVNAVEATEGYSGAHVYELCHFAKVLQEQEEKGLDEALSDALAKVKEQRELISEAQNRTSSRRRSVVSSLGTLPLLSKYLSPSSRCKKLLLSR